MTTPRPQAGDILVSERSARADVFTVSVVPGAGDETVTRYSAAIELVKNLARSRQVNGWFTKDQTPLCTNCERPVVIRAMWILSASR